MVRAALTGGIATGKSFCLSRFAALGAAVIDADVLARAALTPGSQGMRQVVERFGRGVLQQDGHLDRAALARVVFRDRAARADLEAIVHPEVYAGISAWFADLPAGTRVALAEIPLLFETGREHDFQAVVVCACEPAEQFRRLVARDRLTAEEAQARLGAQWPIAEKVRRAHHVVRTDGTLADTDARVRTVFRLLSMDS